MRHRGSRKDEKSEFPDAICLWLPEKFAARDHTQGIIASAGEGWGQYAETSPRICRVKSIEELALCLWIRTNKPLPFELWLRMQFRTRTPFLVERFGIL
jgi:hypothetical protein